jgi:hypothetical protein
MSLLTLGSVAIGRDLASPGATVARDATVPRARAVAVTGGAPEVPPAGAPAGKPNGAVASFGQLLIAQIPAEALIAYTTLLALFSAGDITVNAGGITYTTANTSYSAGRWVLYAAAIVVCAAVVPSSYFAQRDYSFEDAGETASNVRKLHLPILPTVAAMVSMAIYGLTVPGSPLQSEVSGTAFGIWSGCLAVGGGVVMSIFAPFLGKGNGATVKPG